MSFNDVVNVGSVAVDMSQNSLTYQEQNIYLGPLRAHLLGYLCQSVNQVVGRDELSKAVWGRVVSDHTINQHISQLRKIIGSLDAHDLSIATIPKKGYIARCEAESRKVQDEQLNQVQANRILVLEQRGDIYHQLQQELAPMAQQEVELVNDIENFHMQLMTNQFDVLVIDVDGSNGEGLKLAQDVRTGATAAAADITMITMASTAHKELMGFNVLMDVQGLLLKNFSYEHFSRLVNSAVGGSFSLKPNAAYELVPTNFMQHSHNESMPSLAMSN